MRSSSFSTLHLLQLGSLELELQGYSLAGRRSCRLSDRLLFKPSVTTGGNISSQSETCRDLVPSTAHSVILVDSPKELWPWALLSSQNTAVTFEISTTLTSLSLTACPLAIYLVGGLVTLVKKKRRKKNYRILLVPHPPNCHRIPLKQTLSSLITSPLLSVKTDEFLFENKSSCVKTKIKINLGVGRAGWRGKCSQVPIAGYTEPFQGHLIFWGTS